MLMMLLVWGRRGGSGLSKGVFACQENLDLEELWGTMPGFRVWTTGGLEAGKVGGRFTFSLGDVFSFAI